MRRRLRAARLSMLLACLPIGCGSGEPERTNAANANRRTFERYKDFIGKDPRSLRKSGSAKKPPAAKSRPQAAEKP